MFLGLGLCFALWMLIGLVVGALASVVSSGEPPYGLTVDIAVAVAVTVVTGVINYYILRFAEVGGLVAFIIMVLDPLVSAVVFLWLLRVIKRKRRG